MGGYGSGRRCGPTKRRVEDCLILDVNRLNRGGVLDSGRETTISWGEAAIRTKATWEAVTLDYTVSSAFEEPENIRQVVPFTSTDCTFGNWRVWFVCPERSCERRVGRLYLAGKYFLCRHCHDLTYQSRLEGPAGRARLRAQRGRQRLGGDGCLWEPFPEKPKGMHWRTYERLRDQDESATLLGLLG